MDTKALRQKILDLAIRGKLVPQDPNDEPASVLLERIRAEKQQMLKDGKLKAKDLKNDTVIFKSDDNLHYEKFPDGSVKCIEDEIPFELPCGWEWCRLKNICNMCAGKTKATSEIKKDYFLNSYLCYGGNGIRGYVSEYNYDGVFSIIGRQGALCGNVNVAKGKFYATEHAVVVTLYSNIDFIWNNYILEALNLNNYATGAAQPGLAVANILDILVPIPPYQEQIRIGKQIDNIINLINNIEFEKNNLNNTIKQAKSKILDLAIRGKLVPQDPNDEPASVLLERIRAEKEELIRQGKIKRDKRDSVIFRDDDNSYYEKIDGVTRCIDDELPFEIPESWEYIKFFSFFDLISGRDLPTDKHSDVVCGVPYITGASNFSSENVSIFKWTSTPQVITEKDDILITCKGTVGEIAINTFGKAHIARQIMAIRNRYDINNRCIYNCFKYYVESLKESAQGLIPGISRDNILNLYLPIPPIAEQERISSQIEKLFTQLDSIVEMLI